MKGTTGFKGTSTDPTTGFTKFKELRDFIRSYYFQASPGTDITETEEMIFHNYTDGEHWVVAPKVFSLKRYISRSLLYMYDIQLVILRSANTPKSVDAVLTPTLPQIDAPE